MYLLIQIMDSGKYVSHGHYNLKFNNSQAIDKDFKIVKCIFLNFCPKFIKVWRNLWTGRTKNSFRENQMEFSQIFL